MYQFVHYRMIEVCTSPVEAISYDVLCPGAPLPGWGIGDHRGDLWGARGKTESQGDDRRNSHSHQGYHREAKRYCVVQDYHQSK